MTRSIICGIFLTILGFVLFSLSYESVTIKKDALSREKSFYKQEELFVIHGKIKIKKVEQWYKRPLLKSYETIASWYGYNFNGRLMANGQPFNQNRVVAAHKTLPLGTWVTVTNLLNNKTLNVQILDRGPYIKGVEVDLSRHAMQLLGGVEKGIIPILIEPITTY